MKTHLARLSLACGLLACSEEFDDAGAGDSAVEADVADARPEPLDLGRLADATPASVPGDAAPSADAAPPEPDEDLDMRPDDFECLTNWTQVRRFRLTNKLGRIDEALAVANDPNGGVYPVGTVIQLVPSEAMVKRRRGFSEATRDWEFFALKTSAEGTEIVTRGGAEVVNAFGGNCLGCHSLAAPQWDLVCEQSHGCNPLPFTAQQIEALQNADVRCR